MTSKRIAIRDDPEFFEGLTMWRGTPDHPGVPHEVYFAAQVRDYGVVIHLGEGIQRSSENGHPAVLSVEDACVLRDLLNVATARGYL